MVFLGINFSKTLFESDLALFKKINSDWSNSFFDLIMPFLRNAMTWFPLYLFLLAYMLVNFKKNSLWWIVLFISTIALSDIAGTYIIKHSFERVRPCNNPDLFTNIRLLVRCPGGYSFASNHAANHFGMATFFWISFRHIHKKWAGLVFLWAALIAYAQVYVGVHYPSDILGGVVLGITAGYLTGTLFKKQFELTIFDNQPVA